jgi:hypothetical protein
VNRRRWWIHLVLIGGYFTAGIPLALLHVPDRPALSSNPLGLLIVCTISIVLFSIVFALGWLASRASREELLLRWRPGWWVVPLGIGYSVAIRFAAGIVLLVVICFCWMPASSHVSPSNNLSPLTIQTSNGSSTSPPCETIPLTSG